MKPNQAKSWSGLFEGRKSFEEEIGHAVEIDARWEFHDGQLDIFLDGIPGWLPPLWGSDEEWMYFRRPEGVWKTRIPAMIPPGPASIYCRADPARATSKFVGGEYIGRIGRKMGGWISGPHAQAVLNAADLDYERSPQGQGWADGLVADAVGCMLDNVLEDAPGRVVVRAGDLFAQAPVFSVSGEWLLATDPDSGWTVAYGLAEGSVAERALRQRLLCLRFGSVWLAPFDVNVEIGPVAATRG